MPDRIRGRSQLIGIGHQTNPETTTQMFGPAPLVQHHRLGLGRDGHYGYPHFGDRKNVGGPFFLNGTNTNYGYTSSEMFWRGGATNASYTGRLYVEPTAFGIWTASESDSGLGWGAEAYKKMKPAKPEFNALNAAYELRELPALIRQRYLSSGLRGIGSYYLALKFGWEPLLSDTRKMIDLQRHYQKVLRQLLRDNGRPVRRGITLRETMSTPTVTGGTSYSVFKPILVTQYYAEPPKYRQTVYETDKIWARARFRYWLPGGPKDMVWQLKMLARIYGARPSPAVVYNAIPWTWLIDWFTNLGDVVDNLDAGVADRLAADYCYVMRTKKTIREVEASGKFRRKDGSQFSVSASSTAEAFIKTRHRGDPFGFGENRNDLSPTQLAILGALGLSRI